MPTFAVGDTVFWAQVEPDGREPPTVRGVRVSGPHTIIGVNGDLCELAYTGYTVCAADLHATREDAEAALQALKE